MQQHQRCGSLLTAVISLCVIAFLYNYDCVDGAPFKKKSKDPVKVKSKTKAPAKTQKKSIANKLASQIERQKAANQKRKEKAKEAKQRKLDKKAAEIKEKEALKSGQTRSLRQTLINSAEFKLVQAFAKTNIKGKMKESNLHNVLDKIQKYDKSLKTSCENYMEAYNMSSYGIEGSPKLDASIKAVFMNPDAWVSK